MRDDGGGTAERLEKVKMRNSEAHLLYTLMFDAFAESHFNQSSDEI